MQPATQSTTAAALGALQKSTPKLDAKAPLPERDASEIVFVIVVGMGLAFNSGYINGCCMSGLFATGAPKQGVAGFTGAYTNVGMKLADGDWDEFGFNLEMICSFIAGACLSGFINPEMQPYRLGPHYAPTFLIGSAFLWAASLIAETHPESRAYYYFAAAANGLQNGMTSIYSANLIRTCHMTGTSTDIGLLTGQLLRGYTQNVWKLGVLVSLAVPFTLGGFVSYFAMREYANHALLFNAALFFAIAVVGIAYLVMRHGLTLWEATSGSWEWHEALNALESLHYHIDDPASTERRERNSLVDLFDTIDADGSGVISEAELKAALLAVGVDLSESTLSALHAAADKDGSGAISREEWAMLVQNHKAGLGCSCTAPPSPQL